MNLSPTETASRFGVSIKALRVYETRGLLKPLRSQAGWRVYGPDQVARLHQILALKRLGLPLARIAVILAGTDALEPVLELQERVLAREGAKLARALELVRAARAKLRAGQSLSVDDLATLTTETVMTGKPDPQEIKALTDHYAQKHLSAEEIARLGTYADKDAIADWQAVIADAQEVMAGSDPASPAALDVARRWRDVVQRLTGGDAVLMEKGRAAWREALADPAVAAGVPLTPEVMDFLARARAHLPD